MVRQHVVDYTQYGAGYTCSVPAFCGPTKELQTTARKHERRRRLSLAASGFREQSCTKHTEPTPPPPVCQHNKDEKASKTPRPLTHSGPS